MLQPVPLSCCVLKSRLLSSVLAVVCVTAGATQLLCTQVASTQLRPSCRLCYSRCHSAAVYSSRVYSAPSQLSSVLQLVPLSCCVLKSRLLSSVLAVVCVTAGATQLLHTQVASTQLRPSCRLCYSRCHSAAVYSSRVYSAPSQLSSVLQLVPLSCCVLKSRLLSSVLAVVCVTAGATQLLRTQVASTQLRPSCRLCYSRCHSAAVYSSHVYSAPS